MTARLAYWVTGTPAPQGSKTAYPNKGKVVLIESSKKVRPWRDAVAYTTITAAADHGWTALDEAVQISIYFYLARPKSVPKRRIKPEVAPDLDKLARSTLDGIVTAGVISDDARVVSLDLDKSYAEPGSPTGAMITITAWAPL
jgi:crossover junction endodeoxyribonuclease RusA